MSDTRVRRANDRLTLRALLVAVGAMGVFILMLLGYELSWGWVVGSDTDAIGALAPFASAHAGWVRFQVGLSLVLGPMTFRILGLIGAAVALRRGTRRTAVFLVATTIVGGLLVVIVKLAVDRARPTEMTTTTIGTSFPSGHAFGVVVGVVGILCVVLPQLKRVGATVASVVGVVVIGAVGFSRVALLVHHVSDVVAGWALGVVWVVVCVAVIQPSRDRLPVVVEAQESSHQ